MVIKQAKPSEVEGAEVVNTNTGREDSMLTLTFSVKQWRLIAAGCAAVRSSALIDGEAKTVELRAIAKLIAEQTGKGPTP